MQICKSEKACTGCGLCEQLCPSAAISMCWKEGFWYPRVDEEKCIKCGACQKRCPINQEREAVEPLEIWAYQDADQDLLRDSASGGAFGALAREILRRGGIVSGAILDENMRPVHTVCESEEEISLLHDSKYVQAEMGDLVKHLKKPLEEGRPVMASGTPCQMAALREAYGQKYSNLILVDLICTGVPSPKYFQIYIQLLDDRFEKKIKRFLFRDKTRGWRASNILIEFEDGEKKILDRKDCEFMCGFGTNLSLRPCCHHCEFRGYHNSADITLGDYWGIEQITPKFNNDKGCSIVLIKNEKGRELFFRAAEGLLEKSTREHAEKTHTKLWNSARASPYRQSFIKKMEKDPSPKSLEKWIRR